MGDSKATICAALRELMTRQPLASISIQGVCDKAQLSRKTFSRHFADLEEVVCHQMFLDFIQPMRDLHRIMGGLPVDNAVVLQRNLGTLKRHAAYYEDVSRTYGSPWFADQLARLSLTVGFNPYEEYRLGETELSFVEAFYSNAVAGVYRWWMDEGMRTPEEEVARMTDTWLYAHLHELGH